MNTKQTDALRLAAELRAGQWAPNMLQNGHALRGRAADELESLQARVNECGAGAGCCAQAARIEALEAQLEAVGAGGVGPLMAAPAQPVGASRAEFALAALVAAGHVTQAKVDHALALAPQPAAQAQWVPVSDRLPEPGKPVLLDIGGRTPIRAMWAAKHTVEAVEDDTECAEYSEADDTYYSPEGWYEWNQHEEVHWTVSTTPVAWMELPAPYSANATKQGTTP